ncbi:MAG: heavy metal-responsive transcriptional regulator [Blastocatellia bacterium]
MLDPVTRYRVYNPCVTSESDKNGFLRSGELARLAGVSAETLRHYERKGLLVKPRRSGNGYREYPPSALDRVRLVQRALGMGFTLNELARILKTRDKGGVPCREVRSLAERKLEEVEAQMNQLTNLRDDLTDLLKDWDLLLNNSARTERAGLLEALAIKEHSHSRLAHSHITRKKKKEHNE